MSKEEIQGLSNLAKTNLMERLGVQTWQIAEETVKTMNKIPVPAWFAIRDTVVGLKGIAEGSDLGILGGIKETIKDTLKTEIEALTAETKNTVIGAINTLLEPIMPAIQTAANWINSMVTTGVEGLRALFTGEIEKFHLKYQQLYHEQIMVWVDIVANRFVNDFAGRLETLTGYTYEELNAQGTAGGVYSGQFDVDLAALEQQLKDLGLPTYTEEE